MPLFEYRCEDCQRVSTLLVYSWTKEADQACSGCGGGKLNKLISSFSFQRSWGDSLNWTTSGETLADVNEDSPASIDHHMGRIKRDMGGQVTPDFEEMRREAQSGPRSFDPPPSHGHDHGHSH